MFGSKPADSRRPKPASPFSFLRFAKPTRTSVGLFGSKQMLSFDDLASGFPSSDKKLFCANLTDSKAFFSQRVTAVARTPRSTSHMFISSP